MGAVVGVGDQALVDVVAGAGPEKAEVEVLAERGEVLDGVVHQPGREGHHGDHRDRLDGHRPVARVVDEHAQAEPSARQVHGSHRSHPLSCCPVSCVTGRLRAHRAADRLRASAPCPARPMVFDQRNGGAYCRPPSIQSAFSPRARSLGVPSPMLGGEDLAVVAAFHDRALGPVRRRGRAWRRGPPPTPSRRFTSGFSDRRRHLLGVRGGDAVFLGRHQGKGRPAHDVRPHVVALPHQRTERLLGDDLGQDDVGRRGSRRSRASRRGPRRRWCRRRRRRRGTAACPRRWSGSAPADR